MSWLISFNFVNDLFLLDKLKLFYIYTRNRKMFLFK